MGIGSCNCGRKEISLSASCKLETQEGWWCGSSLSLKAWESGHWRRKSQAEHRRRPVSQLNEWSREKNSCFCCVFVLVRFSVNWMKLTHIGSGHSTTSNANLIWKPADTSISNVWPMSAHLVTQSSWYVKLTVETGKKISHLSKSQRKESSWYWIKDHFIHKLQIYCQMEINVYCQLWKWKIYLDQTSDFFKHYV